MITQPAVYLIMFISNIIMMIAIDLSEQQKGDAEPKAIWETNFTKYLDRDGNTTMFFIIEEAKETILAFSQGAVKVL